MASYLRARKLPTLWYQIDESDADPATLFNYLQLATKKVAPRSRRPLPHLTPEYLPSLPNFSRRFFEALYSQIQSPVAIVFDNFQEVQSADSLLEILEIGFSNIPEGAKIIVMSREDPPAKFARLQVSQCITRLTEDELRLTSTETAAIVKLHAASRKWSLTKAQVAQLHEILQGWVAGLVLTLARVKSGRLPNQLLKIQTPQVIFEFLAHEVFEGLNPEVQKVLLITSCLRTINGNMAIKLTNISKAQEILEGLYRTRYFTERRQDNLTSYQFHPLFREFLQIRAAETLPAEQLTQIRIRAAELLDQAGRFEEALELNHAAGRMDLVISLLLNKAPIMLAQGRTSTLENWIHTVPEQFRKSTPWLSYWLGCCRIRFMDGEAQIFFQEALEKFQERQDWAGVQLAWASQVESMFFSWKDLDQLEKFIHQFENLVPSNYHYPTEQIENHVTFAMFAALIWSRPDHPKIKEWESRALRLLGSSPNPAQLAMQAKMLVTYLGWMGRIHDIHQVLIRIREMIPTRRTSPLVHGIMLSIEGFYCWQVGDGPGCLKAAQAMEKIVEDSGELGSALQFLALRVNGELLMGNVEAAEQVLQKSAWKLTHLPLGQRGYYYHQRGHIAFLRGKLDEASYAVEEALKDGYFLKTPYPIALNHICGAMVYHELGREKVARGHLKKAMPIVKGMRSKSLEYVMLLVQAHLAFDNGKDEEGRKSLNAAMKLGQGWGFVEHPWFHPGIMGPLCVRALETGIQVAHVQHLIRKRNLTPNSKPLNLANWPWPIKVWTLGRFAIEADGQPLHFPTKVPKRPLQLLKALIASGRSEVSETYIADQLWPDTEGDAAHKTLVKTVERLRKLLGARATIHLQAGKIILDPQVFWIDMWAFDALLAEEQTHVGIGPHDNKPSNTERALELYQGTFLPEDSAEPWTARLRDRLKQKYIRNLSMLCQAWSQDGKGNEALARLEQAVDHEPLEESLYQQWMQTLHVLGRQTEVPQVYQRCCKTLQATTGQEPSADTNSIYESCRKTS